VLGFLHLPGRLGVAGEAGLGDFRAAGEGFLEDVELGVVGGGKIIICLYTNGDLTQIKEAV
jgi:hypothetical protein